MDIHTSAGKIMNLELPIMNKIVLLQRFLKKT